MRSAGARASLPHTTDGQGATPLHLAALYGHANICEILIRESEVPNLVNMADLQGNTPLHCASWGKSCETVEALVLRGAIVTQPNAKYLVFVYVIFFFDLVNIPNTSSFGVYTTAARKANIKNTSCQLDC